MKLGFISRLYILKFLKELPLRKMSPIKPARETRVNARLTDGSGGHTQRQKAAAFSRGFAEGSLLFLPIATFGVSSEQQMELVFSFSREKLWLTHKLDFLYGY